jgi:hypothetical protein
MKSNFCPSCKISLTKVNSDGSSCHNCGVNLKINFRPYLIWGGCVSFSGWLIMISFFISAWITLIGIIGMVIGIVGAIRDKSSRWIVDDR